MDKNSIFTEIWKAINLIYLALKYAWTYIIKPAYFVFTLVILAPTIYHIYQLLATSTYKDIDVWATWKSLTIIDDIVTREPNKLYQNGKPVAETTGDPVYQGQDVIFDQIDSTSLLKENEIYYYQTTDHQYIKLKLIESHALSALIAGKVARSMQINPIFRRVD